MNIRYPIYEGVYRILTDDEFLGDTMQLLRPDDEFNPQEGYEVVRTLLLDRLQK